MHTTTPRGSGGPLVGRLSRHLSIVGNLAWPAVLGAALALGSALVLLPTARALLACLALLTVVWVIVLPRGWFSGADRGSRRVIGAFLAVRLVMPMVFHSLGRLNEMLLTAGSDSLSYHQRGVGVAVDLLTTGSSLWHRPVPGGGAIDLGVGYLYAFGAPVRIVGDYAWSALAVIGMLLFWWATRHLTGERRVTYTAFLLFAPTLLFWNSGISKEALMTFATGAVVVGVYLLYSRAGTWSGISYLALGVAVAGLVRPHIALLLMVSTLVGVALGTSSEGSMLAPRRLVPLTAAAVCLIILLPLTRTLIDPSGKGSFVDAAYGRAEDAAEIGGRSSFRASPTRSVADMPNAVVTVLLRPFPWEVRTPFQLLASAEMVVIVGMLMRTLWIVAKRRARFLRSPLTVMSATFVLLFCAVFASFGNLGLLVRERMQVLPFVILLIFSIRAPRVKPLAGQPLAGQRLAGHPLAGQPLAGAGQPLAGQHGGRLPLDDKSSP